MTLVDGDAVARRDDQVVRALGELEAHRRPDEPRSGQRLILQDRGDLAFQDAFDGGPAPRLFCAQSIQLRLERRGSGLRLALLRIGVDALDFALQTGDLPNGIEIGHHQVMLGERRQFRAGAGHEPTRFLSERLAFPRYQLEAVRADGLVQGHVDAGAPQVSIARNGHREPEEDDKQGEEARGARAARALVRD